MQYCNVPPCDRKWGAPSHVARAWGQVLLVLLMALLPRQLSAQPQATDPKSPGASAQTALATGAAAEEAEVDLRDIKGLRPPKPSRWPLLAAAVVLACALLIGLWFVWQWHRRRKNSQLPPPRPPEEIALEALAALHQMNFADRAAVRHYYFAISEVLRTYVEARFMLTATQLTTEEIFARLPELVELAPPESLRFRAFLAQTDQVKYARHQPTPEEIGVVYTLAAEFIRATTPLKSLSANATEHA